MTWAARGLALAALLAGCTAVELPGAQAPGSSATFSPDAGGLALDGSVQRIDFGRAPAGVISVLDREIGKGRALGSAGCPAGIVAQTDWDGLVLTFTNERFVGWRKDGAYAGQVCGATA